MRPSAIASNLGQKHVILADRQTDAITTKAIQHIFHVSCSHRTNINNPVQNLWTMARFAAALLGTMICGATAFTLVKPLLPIKSFAMTKGTVVWASQQQDHDEFALMRGDARGAALLLDDVAVSRGSSQILQNVDWRVEPTSKWGLVGPNGAGKSTLLKAIMGELLYDEGNVVVGTTQTVGYLQQTAVSGSNRTIYDEAASAMDKIEKARVQLEEAQARVQETSSEEALLALDRATQQFEAAGGYTQEQEVSTVLKGLGFHNLSITCDELSGGWQMRVSLARLLLSKPSLLLLDEPSNHLDVNARRWLSNYLRNYQDGAMVLVTHDVQLLDSVTHIAEVSAGTLHQYKSCSYAKYLEEKEQRAAAAQSEYERNAEKAAKLQGFVDRFGATATKASAAQSRVKQIEKMQRSGLLDAPSLDQRFRPTLALPDPPRSIGETLLSLENAQVGYDKETPLVNDIQLEIKRGMKLLLRGPNGGEIVPTRKLVL